MHILFPASPMSAVVDTAYEDEYEALLERGARCSVFSFEDFENGRFRPRPALPLDQPVLYRGWMLSVPMYLRLQQALATVAARLEVDAAAYRLCHHLPEWYPHCTDLTPETIVVPRDADFVAAVAGKRWPAWFVKDYVKSLTTQRGSVAAVPEEIASIVDLIEQYRGAVEGGVCIRCFEQLQPQTEQRFFVRRGVPHAAEGEVPELVHEVARRISSPFFSVDVVRAYSGELRLIELGDGQVSDRKHWSARRFAQMLCD